MYIFLLPGTDAVLKAPTITCQSPGFITTKTNAIQILLPVCPALQNDRAIMKGADNKTRVEAVILKSTNITFGYVGYVDPSGQPWFVRAGCKDMWAYLIFRAGSGDMAVLWIGS